jgi:hypothetical protein
MGKSLQDQWPEAGAGLDEHLEYIKRGIEVIESNMILPQDERFQIAYTLLASGRGQKSSVLALGEPGSGKTTFGDTMFGVQNRVEINPQDTVETLYGYPNPIKPTEYVPGSLVTLTQDQIAYINEVPHMANTAPLHRIWDSKSIVINGVETYIDAAAIYGTGNFPDSGPRNHKTDEALRSRVTVLMLTGDHDEARAKKIQGFNALRDKDTTLHPILPKADVRRSIAAQVAQRHPMDRLNERTGDYIVDLVNNLNASKLVLPINIGDARIGEAMHDTARAHMFLKQEKDRKGNFLAIDVRDLARVAALVMPTVVTLSNVANNRLLESAGGRRPNNMEEAIAVRRMISRIALTTYYSSTRETPEDRKKYIAEDVEKYSYANPDAIKSFDVDQAIFTPSKDERRTSQAKDGNDEAPRKRFGFRSR